MILLKQLKILAIATTISTISACGGGDTGSENSSTGSNCERLDGAGTYSFKQDNGSDSFRATFNANGSASYDFSDGGESGNWSVSGSTFTFSSRDFNLNWKITAQSADCKVTQIKGNSPEGQPFTGSRT